MPVACLTTQYLLATQLRCSGYNGVDVLHAGTGSWIEMQVLMFLRQEHVAAVPPI